MKNFCWITSTAAGADISQCFGGVSSIPSSVWIRDVSRRATKPTADPSNGEIELHSFEKVSNCDNLD